MDRFVGQRSQRRAAFVNDAREEPKERDALELVVDGQRVVDVEGDRNPFQCVAGPVTITTKSCGRIHLAAAALMSPAETPSSR